MTSNTSSFVLRMDIRTWTRDSHGLFDYDTTEYLYHSCFLDINSQLYRQRETGRVFEQRDIANSLNSNNDLLLTVDKTNDNYYSIANKFKSKCYPTPEMTTELIDRYWYVLNSIIPSSESNEDYVLNPNDVIKLGRIQYVISEFCINKSSQPDHKEQSYNIGYDNMKHGPIFDLIYQAERYDESKGEDKLCKICYSGDNDDINPLVHLCECKGGIGFAHFNCLKIWMKTKECFKENTVHNCGSYIIKGFNCEICQKPYPFQFSIKGQSKVFPLIEIKRPSNEYIMLESLNQMKDNVNTKIVHVINLKQERYIIGRGHDCDIKINDISVSRTHAVLLYNKNLKKITIKDHKSKFGSLVLIKSPLVFTNRKIQIQIGRTVLETHLVSFKNDDGYNVKNRNEIKKMIDISSNMKNNDCINKEKNEENVETKRYKSVDSDNANVSN